MDFQTDIDLLNAMQRLGSVTEKMNKFAGRDLKDDEKKVFTVILNKFCDNMDEFIRIATAPTLNQEK